MPITSASQQPQPVTEIQWSTDDALPFPSASRRRFSTPNSARRPAQRSQRRSRQRGPRRPGLFMPAVRSARRPRASPLPPADPRRRPLQPDGPGSVAGALSAAASRQPDHPGRPLPLAGSPVTTTPFRCVSVGSVSLSDRNGVTSLMVGADSAAAVAAVLRRPGHARRPPTRPISTLVGRVRPAAGRRRRHDRSVHLEPFTT